MLNNSLWDHRGIVSPCYYGVAALVGPKLAHDLQKVPTIDGAVRSSAVLPQQSPSMILNNTVWGCNKRRAKGYYRCDNVIQVRIV